MCQGKKQVYFECGCWAPIAYTQCQASIDRVAQGGEQLRYEDCSDYKLMDRMATGYRYEILEGSCEKCRKEATKKRERDAKFRQKVKAKEEKTKAAETAKKNRAKMPCGVQRAVKKVFNTKEKPGSDDGTDEHVDGIVARPSMWLADEHQPRSG